MWTTDKYHFNTSKFIIALSQITEITKILIFCEKGQTLNKIKTFFEKQWITKFAARGNFFWVLDKNARNASFKTFWLPFLIHTPIRAWRHLCTTPCEYQDVSLYIQNWLDPTESFTGIEITIIWYSFSLRIYLD